jgi:hypothetical protein
MSIDMSMYNCTRESICLPGLSAASRVAAAGAESARLPLSAGLNYLVPFLMYSRYIRLRTR